MSHYSLGVILPKEHFDILNSSKKELEHYISYFLEAKLEPFEEHPPIDSPFVSEHDMTKSFIEMYIKDTRITYVDEQGNEYNPYHDFLTVTEQVTQEEYEQLPEERRIPTDETFAKVVRFYEPDSKYTVYRKIKDGVKRSSTKTHREKSLYDYIVEDLIGDIDAVPVISFDAEEYNTFYFIRSELNNECLYCTWEETPTIDSFHDLEIISVYNDQGYWDYWDIARGFYIPTKDGSRTAVTKIKNVAAHYESEEPFTTYALLIDGEWYQPDRMGWFGQSTATEEQEKQYKEFFRKALNEADPEDLFVIVDCHI